VLFSFMSLFASAARETIEAWRKDRARLIHEAMAELFSEREGDSPTLDRFYKSIVISPLFRGPYEKLKGELPSYITSSDFATTILQIAREDSKAPEGVAFADWTDKLGDTRVSQLVRLAVVTAGKDPDKTRVFLENWFNSQMDRVSGWYKRSTHFILLIIGFIAAVALNVDAVAITKHLYRNDALREVIVAHAQSKPPAYSAPSQARGTTPQATAGQAEEAATQAVGELRGYGFPIGWSWQGKWPEPDPQCAPGIASGKTGAEGCALDTLDATAIALMIIGWLITAFGISLGAPFWFDVLNRFMVIRSTVKPDEKSPPEASKDRQPATVSVTTPNEGTRTAT
jgi:hypothetical protein